MNQSPPKRSGRGFFLNRLTAVTLRNRLRWPAPTSIHILLAVLLSASWIAWGHPSPDETSQVSIQGESALPQQELQQGPGSTGALVNTGARSAAARAAADGNEVPAGTHDDTPANADAALRAEIESRLSQAVIGKDGFQFTVHSGIVTWTGETDVPQHKGAATRMARSAGAKQVVNRIIVRGTEPPAPRARQGQETPTHVRKAVVRWRSTQRH